MELTLVFISIAPCCFFRRSHATGPLLCAKAQKVKAEHKIGWGGIKKRLHRIIQKSLIETKKRYCPLQKEFFFQRQKGSEPRIFGNFDDFLSPSFQKYLSLKIGNFNCASNHWKRSTKRTRTECGSYPRLSVAIAPCCISFRRPHTTGVAFPFVP